MLIEIELRYDLYVTKMIYKQKHSKGCFNCDYF